MARWFQISFLVVCCLLGWGIVVAPSELMPIEKRKPMAHSLFEFGAIDFVHRRVKFEGDIGELFSKVEMGELVSRQESCRYRNAYHKYLATRQGLFATMDQNIHFATDFGSEQANNCKGLGVMGRHDLHDMSAKDNFQNIVQNIKILVDASWWKQVVLVNDINKDLIDLIVHMAPATHALGVRDPSFGFDPDAAYAAQFQAMQSGFKTAQFSNLNSCDYWNNIDRALGAYLDILTQVDQRIVSHTTALQRKIAGTWMALQTIAPPLDPEVPTRQRPQCSTAASSVKMENSD